jgi:hypothetical protein
MRDGRIVSDRAQTPKLAKPEGSGGAEAAAP